MKRICTPPPAALFLLTVSAALLVLIVGAGAALAWPAGSEPPAVPDQPVGGLLASAIWSNQDLGGIARPAAFAQPGGAPDEFGGGTPREPKQGSGPSNLGRKIKAGALSAVLPGAGQFYNGKKQKAYIMGGVEVAIWATYFIFDTQGDNRMETAEDFANIYAGTSGAHPDTYWQHVARYLDSDAYNEDLYREARALQEPVSGLIGPQDSWQWVNQDRLYGFRKMRADAAGAYDRRDFMILFAVVNRAYSVVDAVMGAGRDDGPLSTRVLGMDLEVAMDPSWRNPSARCVLSRGF